MTNYIEYNKTKYEVKEPTIANWSNVMSLKDLLDEQSLYIKMIEEITGLNRDQIKEIPASQVYNVGDTLFHYINQASKLLHQQIDFKGVKYNVIDIHNISFGQFVDIDTFLSKDEAYRIANLNELAAYLYTEDGTKYGDKPFAPKIEMFKELPMKYVEGAVFFLLSSGKALQQLTTLYSKSRLMWEMMRLRITLVRFGDGIKRLVSSQTTKFGKLILFLISPLLLVSIICLTLWTLISKKKKR